MEKLAALYSTDVGAVGYLILEGLSRDLGDFAASCLSRKDAALRTSTLQYGREMVEQRKELHEKFVNKVSKAWR